MKDIRQGNDLKVAWSILKQDGEPFRLEGKDVSLYLKSMFGRKELNDFVVTGNIIQWTFYGKDQTNTGKYSLILVVNEGEKGMITTDTCDFVNLVSCSCKLQGGEDAPNVETESIDLTSTLEYVAGGVDYDDTALWKELENKVDKVEGLGLSEENYTAEDKGKLSGLKNYDDSGIKDELAKKAEKSEIPTKMSQLEQDVEIGSSYDDSELWNFVWDLDNQVSARREEILNLQTSDVVQAAQLTELSAEVGGLSEKIENLPSGESSVFKAVYGTTTIEEVTEAYNAGKVIHCDYDGRCYILSAFNSGQAFFASLTANNSTRLELKQDSRWAISYYQMEVVSNKTKTLSESSTDTQYPSAKAVYDFVQNSKDVFYAEYGVTTYDEIIEAHNAKKEVLCKYYISSNDCRIARLVLVNDGVLVYFQVTVGSDTQRLVCYPSNVWNNLYINNSHKLEDLDNGNVQVTIAGKTAEVVTPQNVGKQGVIRQTQNWTQAADQGYDYVMSDLVRGAIPQANIDLFTSAGAVFNEESGYFELNGLTDISYDEMRAIYNAGFKMVEGYWKNNIRTNIFRPCNVYNADAAQLYGFTGMYANRNCKAESFKFTEQETYGVLLKGTMYGTYEGCIYLKTFGNGVFFCQDTNISDQAFNRCYSLETIYIRSLKKNIWFKDSARLSEASVLYMVAQSAATSAIVITLHADAYARAMADAEIVAALEAHPNVSLASA